MPERRHIRVSRSLEGEGERPARRYGVTPSRCATSRHDRLKPVLRYFAGAKPFSMLPNTMFTCSSADAFSTLPLQLGQQKPTSASPIAS